MPVRSSESEGGRDREDQEFMNTTYDKKRMREDNPFEDEVVAREWINSIENERGLIRDKELYPFLQKWAEKVQPKIIIDIGSGQGICADKVQLKNTHYIGIDSSVHLVERARKLYTHLNREFIVGNAYKLPLPDQCADAAFSINVWFHLEDLKTASQELARILKPGGNFLISTANPSSYDTWESLFFDYSKESKKIDGKVRIPINPLSRNVFYLHSLKEITKTLTQNHLKIESVEEFGYKKEKYKDVAFFINIIGQKQPRPRQVV